MAKVAKVLLWLVAGLACLWIVLFIAANRLAARNTAREWPDGLGPMADVVKRFPDRTISASALELERLAKPLGVSVAPRGADAPASKETARYDAVLTKLGEYERQQVERRSDALDAPPAEVEQFLTAEDSTISAVRDHLLNAPPIVWEMRIEDGVNAKLPNLLGHMQLLRILTARALRSAQRGDSAGWADLHAAWILSRSLWSRPDLISILIALGGTRMVNAAAAKMPGNEPAWLAEMRAFDYRGAAAASYQAETWMSFHMVETTGVSSDPTAARSFAHRAVYYATLPYQRLSVADYLELMRRRTVAMAAHHECEMTEASLGPIGEATTPARWNVLARISMPNLLGAWARVARFQAELERTERIAQIKRGERPAEASRCSDGKWQFGGTPVLKFSKEIAMPTGTKYPLEYEAVAR